MFAFKLQDFREDPESKAVAEVHQKLFEVRPFLVQCSYGLLLYIQLDQYLFSDLLKVYSEFSKSAPGTSSSCRLYNNHVEDTQDKVTGDHVMYDCGA